MGHAVGVLAMEHIAAGLVEGDRIVGPIRTYPDQADEGSSVLPTLPAADIVQAIGRLIDEVGQGRPLDVVGVGFPGVIRDGVIEDSPNLQQMKGSALARSLSEALSGRAHVLVLNDADAVATGIAATRGQLDTLTRVWTLGSGVGFGRYPHAPGVWEGGHVVVSLDPKESLCGCGGQGHLEGIVGPPQHAPAIPRHGARRGLRPGGRAAMRDAPRSSGSGIEPSPQPPRAASTWTGPGRFFLSGPNARFVDTAVLAGALHDMVKMSPLQGSAFEVIARSDDLAIIGAAVGARQSAA